MRSKVTVKVTRLAEVQGLATGGFKKVDICVSAILPSTKPGTFVTLIFLATDKLPLLLWHRATIQQGEAIIHGWNGKIGQVKLKWVERSHMTRSIYNNDNVKETHF